MFAAIDPEGRFGDMKKIVLLMVFIFSNWILAQSENIDVRDPRLNEGQMFTVKLTPADRRIEVSVVGAPAALLGPERIEIFGREVHSGKTKTLTIRPSGEAFEIVERLNLGVPIELDVRDKENKKKETFKFDLRQQRP